MEALKIFLSYKIKLKSQLRFFWNIPIKNDFQGVQKKFTSKKFSQFDEIDGFKKSLSTQKVG